MKLKPSSRLPGLGITAANELLKVHVSYGPLVQKLLKKFNPGTRRSWGVKGLVHITGGGFMDNIPRVLPEGLGCHIDATAWACPEIFEWLQSEGGVTDTEMRRTFNCGIGLIIIVPPEDADQARKMLAASGETAYPNGEIQTGHAGEVFE